MAAVVMVWVRKRFSAGFVWCAHGKAICEVLPHVVFRVCFMQCLMVQCFDGAVWSNMIVFQNGMLWPRGMTV